MLDAYKDIVCFCDMRVATPDFFAPALSLAARSSAHVTLVGLIPDVKAVENAAMVAASGQMPVAGSVAAMKDAQTDLDKQALEVAAAIGKRATAANVRHTWRTHRVVPEQMGEEAAAIARTHDLCVIAQPGEGAESNWASTIETLVTTGGRPVLVVPVDLPAPQHTIGSEIVVAWDESKEAARAVHDAMPLLAQSGKTTIAIAPKSLEDGTDPLSLGARLSEHLTTHGIASATHIIDLDDNDSSIARALAGLAEKSGADLLVMGAHGKSWISEKLFGSVTTEMMDRLRVPVLLSH